MKLSVMNKDEIVEVLEVMNLVVIDNVFVLLLPGGKYYSLGAAA